jgi:hypothetical protein
MTVISETDQHLARLDDGILRCAIRRVPERSAADGADLFKTLAAKLKAQVTTADAFILDLREAPQVAGPQTAEVVGSLFQTFARYKRRVAVVTAQDPVQQLQMRRLITENAPRLGALFTDDAAAEAFVIAPDR